jgi:hypothetical protein
MSDMNSALLEAGLVDTTGAPTTAANFGTAPEPDRDAISWGDTGLEEVGDQPKAEATVQTAAANSTSAPAPQGQFQDQPAPSTSYTPQQAFSLGQQQIVAQMNEAIMAGLEMRNADGQPLYTRAALEQHFAPILENQMTRLQNDLVKHQMAPYARRMAAEDIARQHKVDVKEIINEPSIDAMQAAARALARFQRDDNFKARASSGRDTVEGGGGMSGAISQAYEKLSPQQKIRYGLMRGDS